MLSEEFASVREKRARRAKAAEFLYSRYTGGAGFESIDWLRLLELPDWCYWSKPQRDRLLLVTGALLVSSAIRLWIDSSRIRKARELLGSETFERVMASTIKPMAQESLPDSGEVEEILLSAGAAVLLANADKAWRALLVSLLPPLAGEIATETAELCIAQAFSILGQAEAAEKQPASDRLGEMPNLRGEQK